MNRLLKETNTEIGEPREQVPRGEGVHQMRLLYHHSSYHHLMTSFDDFLPSFESYTGRTDLRTYGRTDGRTDTTSYRCVVAFKKRRDEKRRSLLQTSYLMLDFYFANAIIIGLAHVKDDMISN